ncbi:MAG: hypothetical protein CME33_17755 [Gimesia sp.]|uniref:hypothetical protein n=1 Tax=Gimesia sp. TaxID=2024833 RepID=UPI000C418AF8|nr:hypothetical protein [Gimesia sp.]MAX38403.1 hypothetical protein [Gimesia sp.]|tara:strand:+ start:7609 stop:8505 length:897 start_codon:yes stop_codon:yes gene_type:complete
MNESDARIDGLQKSYRRKLQLIRDRVRSVAECYHTAIYIVGRPGTSKTFTVKEELERLSVPFVIRNARMTPMGLFDFLHEHPEHIIVLDDIASLFGQPAALQILMAALDGDPDVPRKVTYKSKDKSISFEFSGGIIAISNVPLRQDPLANAVTSRLVQLEHEPSDEEIAAFMFHLSLEGYKDLTSDECKEVVEFIVAETRQYDERLDLRHLAKAYEDRRQWEHGNSMTQWQDLVRTSLNKMMVESSIPMTKADEIELQRSKVKEVIQRFPNDRERQMKESQLKKSTFYKRLRELQTAS